MVAAIEGGEVLTDSILLANARVTRRIPPFVVVSTCTGLSLV